MKLLRVSVLASLAVLTAAAASGQMGLYGSPEPLRLAPAMSAAPSEGRAVSYAVPAPGPAIEPPPPVYQPMPPRPPVLPPPAATPYAPGVPVPGPSMVNDMVAEPSPSPSNVVSGGYAGCNDCAAPTGGACAGDCVDQCCELACPWYTSITTLVMSRNRANKLWTTYEAGNAPNQIPTFPDYDWRWGGEVTLGYRFCCGCAPWAIEGTYWGLDAFEVATAPAQVVPAYSTPFMVGDLTIPGRNVNDDTADLWFDNSPEHRVWRASEFHNAEINLVRNQLFGPACGPWNFDWSLGVRWFHFRDHLVFGAEHGALDGMGNPSAYAGEWIYLDDQVTNNLIGMQMGLSAQYRIGACWKLFATPKVGVYDNLMELNYDIHAGADSATQTAYPNLQYPIHSTSNGFSFLTQVDVGLGWQITPRWEAKIGYRVIAVTGVALAENQVPTYGVDTQAVADIDRNGSLILHGAFTGVTYSF